MLDIVKNHLAAFASGDWARFQDTLAKDAVYVEMPIGEPMAGSEAIMSGAEKWKRSFSDLAAEIESASEAGDKVFVELRWQGTHNGPMDGPLGTIEATGKHCSVPACMVFTIRGGRIALVHQYFDVLTLLRQLGAMGQPGGEAHAAE